MSIDPLTLPRPSVDATAFREAMARLASGVAVVACWDGETPRGLLVSSLTALSTQPPRVLFCVGKTASSHAALLAAQDCSLNLLSDEDQGVAERRRRGLDIRRGNEGKTRRARGGGGMGRAGGACISTGGGGAGRKAPAQAARRGPR